MNVLNLKFLREENHKNQKEIAKILDITPAGYNNYEKQKTEPSVDILIKLADYYNVSLDYLVGREWGNGLGFLSEQQIQFIQMFLKLNQSNQVNAVIFVSNMLANQ